MFYEKPSDESKHEVEEDKNDENHSEKTEGKFYKKNERTVDESVMEI